MSKRLDDLDAKLRPLAFELLARCVETKIPVTIIDTLRTKEEQERYVKEGVSWTLNSKHLIGLAIDIAPTEVLFLKNWAPNHPSWLALGEIGERLGLRWGGRWKVRDLGHFEFKSSTR